MFRSLRFLAVVVAAVLCALTLGGAALPPPPLPNPVVWLRSFDDVFSRGTRLVETYRPGKTPVLTELSTQRTRLDELLSAVPADPPEEVVAAVVRGQRLAVELDAIDVAHAAVVPVEGTPLLTRVQLQLDMRKVAREAIEDVACGEVWDLLSDDQKERLGVPVEVHDHLDSALGAIEEKTRSNLAANWNPEFLDRAVSWFTYAQGVRVKAFAVAEFVKGGQFTSTDVLAFSYYFRYCVKPPG
ncbi:hypothetical protein AB0B13_23810 [Streptomyces sp. NPDC042898]|uniref:hypothetical protein n=1 Tax=Streptomyces sp. NPDC042898 TaxID=3154334 RepID=UPI0033D42B25